MKVDLKVIKEIEAINYFEKCGFKETLKLQHEYRMLKDLNRIDDKGIIYNWNNTCLEAMNEIRTYFYDNFHDIYTNEWNILAKEIRDDIMPHITEIVSLRYSSTPFANREELLVSIKSNIMEILLANSVKEYYKSEFYEDLFSIYKSGHIPCGWIGSRLYGKFKIY